VNIPPIDQTLLPPAVRDGGPQAKQLYAAALSFEQQLTQQLTQALADSSQSDSGSSDSGDPSDDSLVGQSDATSSMFTQMLPDAMAQGLSASGGVGLADQLYAMLANAAGITQPAQTPPSGAAPGTPSTAGGGSA
jgi:Rod binding domain-containing protein